MSVIITSEISLDMLLSFIRGEGKFGGFGEGINSYPNRDANNKKIHAGCLELERRKLIYRHLETDDHIFWKPLKP